jgi:hypothetical protein
VKDNSIDGSHHIIGIDEAKIAANTQRAGENKQTKKKEQEKKKSQRFPRPPSKSSHTCSLVWVALARLHPPIFIFDLCGRTSGV